MSKHSISFTGTARLYRNMREEVLDITDRVLATGQWVGGPETAQFERLIAERCNRKHAIAVNSGTAALIFAHSLIRRRERVLVTNFSFKATKLAAAWSEQVVVPVGVAADGLMDMDQVSKALQHIIVKGVVGVNLFGKMLDWTMLGTLVSLATAHEWHPIIEDAAQSFGASHRGQPSGSFGDVSVLSFDPMKNLPSFGSGGMILTDSRSIADDARDWRRVGGDQLGRNQMVTNAQMSEVECALMVAKLGHFDEWQARRAAIAAHYTSVIDPLFAGDNRMMNRTRDGSGIVLGLVHNAVPATASTIDDVHSWHKYVIKVPDRNRVCDALAAAGIETKHHYPYTLGHNSSAADRASWHFTQTVISLPIYPELTDAEVEHIASTAYSAISDALKDARSQPQSYVSLKG